MTEQEIELSPDERRKARQRAYYALNREKIRQQQREYYQKIDKEVHAARVRKYRHEHHEQNLATQRAYRKKNRAHINEQDRIYRQKNKEKVQERQKKYANSHEEQIRERRKKYYADNKERFHQYYVEHRYEFCLERLEGSSVRSMELIQQQVPDKVSLLFDKWSFEMIAHKKILWQLQRSGIYPGNRLYDDCYDAGMLAYLYTIHRCALMDYQHVEAYLWKLIRIFINCAIVVGKRNYPTSYNDQWICTSSGEEQSSFAR